MSIPSLTPVAPPDSNVNTDTTVSSGKLDLDADGFLRVWTDGACAFNGKDGAVAGIGVWFGHSHPLNYSEQIREHATNQRAELLAAIRAAQIIIEKQPQVRKLRIYSDSKYLRDCWVDWIPRWELNNWMSRGNNAIVNRDLLETMADAFRTFDALEVRFVPSHAGELGNTEADNLARLATQMTNINAEEDISILDVDAPLEHLAVSGADTSLRFTPLKMKFKLVDQVINGMVDTGATRTFFNLDTWQTRS